MAWYTAFIPEIVGYVSNYFTKKQERQLALETGTLKLKQSKQTGEHEVTMTDAEGEAVLARGLENSWKDEYLVLLFSLPLILCFTGEWGRSAVADGFAALEKMPEWYQYTLGVIVASSFAVRSATKFFRK